MGQQLDRSPAPVRDQAEQDRARLVLRDKARQIGLEVREPSGGDKAGKVFVFPPEPRDYAAKEGLFLVDPFADGAYKEFSSSLPRAEAGYFDANQAGQGS